MENKKYNLAEYAVLTATKGEREMKKVFPRMLACTVARQKTYRRSSCYGCV